jgi:Predicted AAA-ATPase
LLIPQIYLLVDEYDSFSNYYLESWRADTLLVNTFKSFWSTVKLLNRRGGIQKIFITGLSPLSLTGVASGFNVAQNLSFDNELAGLCGLTSTDIKTALKKVLGEDSEAYQRHLSIMTKSFNGFYFCRQVGAETVYNTETCLSYLQVRTDTPDYFQFYSYFQLLIIDVIIEPYKREDTRS